jgi:hypothetical protein
MKEEAKHLGIRRLFTFTLTEVFFKMLGFTRQNQAELPPKVWGECSRCPKYFQCDEVGMAQDLLWREGLSVSCINGRKSPAFPGLNRVCKTPL